MAVAALRCQGPPGPLKGGAGLVGAPPAEVPARVLGVPRRTATDINGGAAAAVGTSRVAPRVERRRPGVGAGPSGTIMPPENRGQSTVHAAVPAQAEVGRRKTTTEPLPPLWRPIGPI